MNTVDRGPAQWRIADRLVFSERMVRFHLRHVVAWPNVDNRVQAVEVIPVHEVGHRILGAAAADPHAGQ